MKKQSPMARKHAARLRTAQYQAFVATNAQAQADLRQAIRKDVRGLQIDAGLHSFAGDDAHNLINLSGRICFITLCASAAAGYSQDHTDMRIVRGMSEALGDLNASPQDLERHRPAIQSGLAAIDRLLLDYDDMALVFAAAQLDELLDRPEGVGTADMRNILETTQ